MQAKSFIDILSNELRKEIRAEVEAELAASRAKPAAHFESSHKSEQVELWLNLRMGGAFVGTKPHKTSAYCKQAKQRPTKSTSHQPSTTRQLPSATTQELVRERAGKVATIEQTFAFEFFVREGSALGSDFSESQLKSEFRKIALRIHPDRHTGASIEQLRALSSRFQTLVESAEVLEAALI